MRIPLLALTVLTVFGGEACAQSALEQLANGGSLGNAVGSRILSPDEVAILGGRCARGQGDPDNTGCRPNEWVVRDLLGSSGLSLGTSSGTFSPSGSAVLRREQTFTDPISSR